MTQPVIQIFDIGNGQYQAVTKLSPIQTANIFIGLGLTFTRQDEHTQTLKKQKGNIINPITGELCAITKEQKN